MQKFSRPNKGIRRANAGFEVKTHSWDYRHETDPVELRVRFREYVYSNRLKKIPRGVFGKGYFDDVRSFKQYPSDFRFFKSLFLKKHKIVKSRLYDNINNYFTPPNNLLGPDV